MFDYQQAQDRYDLARALHFNQLFTAVVFPWSSLWGTYKLLDRYKLIDLQILYY